MADKTPGPIGTSHVCTVAPSHRPFTSAVATPGTSGGQMGKGHYEEKQDAFQKAVDPIIEIADHSGDAVMKAIHRVKLISAQEAFRKYNFVKEEMIKNVAGNLRGIVINAKARVVYDVVTKVHEWGEPITKRVALIGYLLTFAEEVARGVPEAEKIVKGNDDAGTKGDRVLNEAVAASARTAAKIATGATVGTLSLVFKGAGLVALNHYQQDPLYKFGQWLEKQRTYSDHWVDELVTGEHLAIGQERLLTGAAKFGRQIGADKVGEQIRQRVTQAGQQAGAHATQAGQKVQNAALQAEQEAAYLVHSVVTFMHK